MTQAPIMKARPSAAAIPKKITMGRYSSRNAFMEPGMGYGLAAGETAESRGLLAPSRAGFKPCWRTEFHLRIVRRNTGLADRKKAPATDRRGPSNSGGEFTSKGDQ